MRAVLFSILVIMLLGGLAIAALFIYYAISPSSSSAGTVFKSSVAAGSTAAADTGGGPDFPTGYDQPGSSSSGTTCPVCTPCSCSYSSSSSAPPASQFSSSPQGQIVPSTGGVAAPVLNSSSSSSPYVNDSCSGVTASNNLPLLIATVTWNVNEIGCYVVGMFVEVAWIGSSNEFIQGWVVAVDPSAPSITVNATLISGTSVSPTTNWTPWVFSLLWEPTSSSSSSSSSAGAVVSCSDVNVVASNFLPLLIDITVWEVDQIGCFAVDDFVQIAYVLDSTQFTEGWIIAVNPVALTITVNSTLLNGTSAGFLTPWLFTLLSPPSSTASSIGSGEGPSSTNASCFDNVISSSNVTLLTGVVVYDVNTVGCYGVSDIVQVTANNANYVQGTITNIYPLVPSIVVNSFLISPNGTLGMWFTSWTFSMLSFPSIQPTPSSSSGGGATGGGAVVSRSSSSSPNTSCVGVLATNVLPLLIGIPIAYVVNRIGCFQVNDYVQITWVSNSNDYTRGWVLAVNYAIPTITVNSTYLSPNNTGLNINWSPWSITLLLAAGYSSSSSSSS